MPILINRKDRDKLEKVTSEYRKRFMYDRTISEYDNFVNAMTDVVDMLDEKYRKLDFLSKIVENIILSVILLKDIITSNYALVKSKASV